MISCKDYVAAKKEEIRNDVNFLSKKPCLCVVQIGDNAASNSYVKGKRKDCEDTGIKFMHMHIEDIDNTSEEDMENML